jgi:dipeptide/tripeptide permease
MSNRYLFGAIGGLFAVIITQFVSRENNYTSAILGGLTGIIITFGIMRLIKKPKEDNVPERDERLDAMISKFINYLSTSAIGIVWISVLTLDYLGFDSVDLDYIYGFLLLVVFIFIIGISILKKK